MTAGAREPDEGGGLAAPRQRQYEEVGPAAPGAPRRPQYAEVGPAVYAEVGPAAPESNAAGPSMPLAGRSPAFSASVGYEQPDDVMAAAALQAAGGDYSDLEGVQAQYAQSAGRAAGGSVAVDLSDYC